MGRLTRRFRGAVRREAHDLLRGGPPTAELLRPVGPAVPSDAHVQQVLDVCMRVGEVLLGSGEPAEETSDDDAPHGGGTGPADRGRRHHVQLDHHVLPPRQVRGAR